MKNKDILWTFLSLPEKQIKTYAKNFACKDFTPYDFNGVKGINENGIIVSFSWWECGELIDEKDFSISWDFLQKNI